MLRLERSSGGARSFARPRLDLEAENRALRDQIEELREHVTYLKGLLSPCLQLRTVRLTKTEEIMLGVLLGRPVATHEALVAAIYWLRGLEEANSNSLSVMMCNLRQKMKALDVEIQTIWGRGYRLDDVAKERLRADLLTGEA